jgi:hypothetical protein
MRGVPRRFPMMVSYEIESLIRSLLVVVGEPESAFDDATSVSVSRVKTFDSAEVVLETFREAYVAAHEGEVASWGDGPFTDEDFSKSDVARMHERQAFERKVLALPASVFMEAHTKGREAFMAEMLEEGAYAIYEDGESTYRRAREAGRKAVRSVFDGALAEEASKDA